MNIEKAGTPNYRAGRNARKPIAIVNHITAGAYPGCLNWMQNPRSKASAHYLITKTGKIIQLLKGEDTAWHTGQVNKPNWKLYDGTNPNIYTLGIEHENLGGGELTEEQYQATLWLHKHLIARWGIPVDTDRIIGHYRIDSVNRPNCPGPKFPWDRLFYDLKRGKKKMKNLILCNPGVDERAAGYLADHLRSPRDFLSNVDDKTLNCAEVVYVIGSREKPVANCVNIVGADRYDTCQKVLNICQGR